MGMNKKGAIVFKVLVATALFMFAMLFMNLMMDDVTLTRDATHLNCASPDTDGDKVLCLVVDGIIPLFIFAVITAIAVYLGGRR